MAMPQGQHRDGFQRTAEGSGSVMLSALGGLPGAFPWWPQSHAFHQNQKGSVSEFWREVRAMVRGSYIHLPEMLRLAWMITISCLLKTRSNLWWVTVDFARCWSEFSLIYGRRGDGQML